jgi:hypothetical protein
MGSASYLATLCCQVSTALRERGRVIWNYWISLDVGIVLLLLLFFVLLFLSLIYSIELSRGLLDFLCLQLLLRSPFDIQKV